jgi:hypothetical protein
MPPSPRPNVTPLSHLEPRRTGALGRIWGLARLSLGTGLMAGISAGCVVSDPPEYGVARQTPPFLDATSAFPDLFYRVDLTSGQTKSFGAELRSEDAGEPILAQLFLDYNVTDGNIPRQRVLGFKQVAASTIDDAKRTVQIPWLVQGVTPGCYPISLVVTHVGNLDETNKPKNSTDTAILTWWVSIDEPGDMAQCPVQGAAQ